MTDFKRLIDEVDSDLARAVLSSGRVSTSNGARQKQVLAALGVGLVIGSTNKISMAAMSTWQKVVFIGGVACVGAGGAMTYTHLAAPSQVDVPQVQAHAAQTVRSEERVVPQLTAPSELEAPSAAGHVEALQERLVPPAIGTVKPQAAVSMTGPNTRSGARESSVKAELGLLEQARGSLNGGSPSGALQVLARYGERYPRGSMRLEAEVLKVEALAASGRTREAARLADRLLVRNPKSVVASRLRRFASKD